MGREMVSTEEKKVFIHSIQDATLKGKDMQIPLRELLMRDTNCGKLYKYRVVSKKNIDCLVNGTMYCALPESFNDPFDCKIGYTFTGLYDAKFGAEMDRLNQVLAEYISVLEGTRLITDCSVSHRPIIEKIMNNEKVSSFFRDSRKIAKTSKEESELIQKSTFVLTDLVGLLLEDKELAPYFEIVSTVIPRLFQNITPDGVLKLSQDNPSFDDFASSYGIAEDTDEIGKMVLLSHKLAPDKVNETASVQKTLRNGENTISKKMLNLFRVGCLSTNYKNRLMWSHYANAHKGYCVEYDFGGTDSYTMEHLPLPIVYSRERPLIPWKAAIDNTPKNMDEASMQIFTGLLTKDRAWEYENEWRIMIPCTSDPLFKMPPITCIYLGASINKQNKNRIIRIAKEKGLQVKQMVVDRGAYELHAESVL